MAPWGIIWLKSWKHVSKSPREILFSASPSAPSNKRSRTFLNIAYSRSASGGTSLCWPPQTPSTPPPTLNMALTTRSTSDRTMKPSPSKSKLLNSMSNLSFLPCPIRTARPETRSGKSMYPLRSLSNATCNSSAAVTQGSGRPDNSCRMRASSCLPSTRPAEMDSILWKMSRTPSGEKPVDCTSVSTISEPISAVNRSASAVAEGSCSTTSSSSHQPQCTPPCASVRAASTMSAHVSMSSPRSLISRFALSVQVTTTSSRLTSSTVKTSLRSTACRSSCLPTSSGT
mmetsp:Transcript_60124/g.167762  ORF Transcript_60124/g.167762 Transcript_60124/m.167762 type:complete len:286 (+) Transcript_60124:177-1034(+)